MTTVCKTLKDFKKLEMDAFKGNSGQSSKQYKYHKWLYENGQTFRDVNKELSDKISKAGHCKIKQCYLNVWRAVLDGQGLKYYEGLVISDNLPIPIEHCFAVKDGQVVDPTLVINVKGADNRVGDEYFGIEIPKSYIVKKALQTEMSGPFVYDYFFEQINS